MKRTCLLLCISISLAFAGEYWGFFAHRLINRMAVFTLPSDMILLFKENIKFIEEHAIDPDKRRYSVSEEAIRHYIDIDHWGKNAIDSMPHRFAEALMFYGNWYQEDSIPWVFKNHDDSVQVSIQNKNFLIDKQQLARDIEFCLAGILELPSFTIPIDSITSMNDILTDGLVTIDNVFSEFGVLPFHLIKMHRLLESAFFEKNLKRVVTLATEFGHYLSDAHVPLHTTENYNGQLTDQIGIHAFWESRIPELFAEKEYDFMVGQAEYITDVETFIWDIVRESHAHVDSVLQIEKRLRTRYPPEQQYCFEERLEQTIRTPCPEFARAYQTALNGMVEDRMRAAIHNLGSLWYTAWVNAGQPDLNPPVNQPFFTHEELVELKRLQVQGKALGRDHQN